ncbi:hypothetical protein [Bilophila wadsworthia]
MKLPSYFVFFAWIPTSLALAWGSVSFMLLNPDITSWPLGARLFLLFYTALLAYIPNLAKNNIKSLVLFVLSGTASYAFFSFLLLCPLPTEWSDTTRWLSVFMFSCLAFSFAPSEDDVWDRFSWTINSLGIHMAIFFLPKIFS